MDYETILSRKLVSLFPETQTRAAVAEILDLYGMEKYEKEPLRVRLAILKLSSLDMAAIERTTNIAKQDYRDVLAWAEYPRQSKIPQQLPDGPEKQKIIDADRTEYEEWLNS